MGRLLCPSHSGLLAWHGVPLCVSESMFLFSRPFCSGGAFLARLPRVTSRYSHCKSYGFANPELLGTNTVLSEKEGSPARIQSALSGFVPSAKLNTGRAKRLPPRRSPPLETDLYFMRQAFKLAEEAYQDGEVPIGAVLVAECGTVIGKGRNRVECSGTVCAHAEMEALRVLDDAPRHSAGWRRLGCTMYTTIEPCAMCLSAMCLARVRRVVYGAPDLRLGALGTWIDLASVPHPFHMMEEVTGGVMEDEAAALMRTFFKSRR